MDNISIWLKAAFIVLLLLVPLANAWERKKRYGKAESGQQAFITRSKFQGSVRLAQSSSSSGRPEAVYHYSWALLAAQYIPVLIILCLAVTAPLMTALFSHRVLPRMETSLVFFMSSVWVTFAIIFLVFSSKRHQAFISIYQDGLLLARGKFNSPEQTAPYMFFITDCIQWLGPCTWEAEQHIKSTRVPIMKFIPFPYWPLYLDKWALVYGDGSYQYALIFYLDKKMTEALQRSFRQPSRYHISSILRDNQSVKTRSPSI